MLLRHGEAVNSTLKEKGCVELRAEEEPGLFLEDLGQHREEAVDDVGPVRQARRRLDITETFLRLGSGNQRNFILINLLHLSTKVLSNFSS